NENVVSAYVDVSPTRNEKVATSAYVFVTNTRNGNVATTNESTLTNARVNNTGTSVFKMVVTDKSTKSPIVHQAETRKEILALKEKIWDSQKKIHLENEINTLKQKKHDSGNIDKPKDPRDKEKKDHRNGMPCEEMEETLDFFNSSGDERDYSRGRLADPFIEETHIQPEEMEDQIICDSESNDERNGEKSTPNSNVSLKADSMTYCACCDLKLMVVCTLTRPLPSGLSNRTNRTSLPEFLIIVIAIDVVL
ncbi:16299_t:CDS:2, partial [Rhizophagus irregularis]